MSILTLENIIFFKVAVTEKKEENDFWNHAVHLPIPFNSLWFMFYDEGD